ncbi:MAG: DUF2262 domain-containing protein [Clostridiales bacterium]|nr:DUF2262 domain-containing protein [Clostridiales bacterium]
MNKEDLIRVNDKYWAYKAPATIWGSELKVNIGIGFTLPEEQLDALVSVIEKRIAFLNDSRADIEKEVLDYGAVDLANDWAESAEPDENEENVYIMEDGAKVRLPISEEYFLSTLRIDEAAIEFSDSLDEVETTVYVACDPDFFAGHAFEVCIDEAGSIDRCVFAG